MTSTPDKSSFYEFGSFRIDVANRLLLQGSEIAPLQPKTFDILLLLVENRGRVLEKDELMRRVWPDTVVEESNLTQNIYVLRKIFSADTDGQKYIETMARRGYRFVAPVSAGAGRATEAERLAPEMNVVLALQPANGEAADGEARTQEASVTRLPERSASRRRLPAWPKWLLVSLIVALALGIAAYLVFRPGPPKQIQSIAVLPLVALNSDADQEALGWGIADDLTTRLSSTRQIVVRPMSLVKRQAGGEQDPVVIGRALTVDAVLTGTVRKANDRIRVNAQLLRVADGLALWAGKFDVKLADLLAMQDQVAEQLAQALTLPLSSEGKRLLIRHYTDDPEAYELYVKGDYYLKKRTRASFTTSIDYLQQARQKDPQYALAYRGLAAAYTLQSLYGFAPAKEAMPQAERMARRALELDATLAGAHVALGSVHMFYDWDLAAAASELQRAIELDPALPEAHQIYALYLAVVRRFADARQQLQIAHDLDPGSLVIESSTLWVLYLSGQYDEAITLGRQAIEPDAGFYPLYQHLGYAYLARQMYEPALATLQRARILSANAPASLARLGYAQGVAGKQQEARQTLKELQEMAAPAAAIAWVHLGLQEDRQALVWLEKAYEERAADLIYLNTDPIYERLRAQPEFKALLQRVGFIGIPEARRVGRLLPDTFKGAAASDAAEDIFRTGA